MTRVQKGGVVVMKKIFFSFVFSVFILVSPFAQAQIPNDLQKRLLSHPWNGFITDEESTNNSQTSILVHFTLDENKEITGTITLFSYDVGNGRFNFTRFIDVSYDYFKQSLILSFWPPATPIDTVMWVLESTLIDNQFISGLYLERPKPSEPEHKRKKGTFRIQ